MINYIILGALSLVIDEVKEYCIELHLYNWGEPPLNKYLIGTAIKSSSI